MTNIIEQMEAIVANVMKRFQSDFYHYDLPAFKSEDFKFPAIWGVSECGTKLIELGAYKQWFFEKESERYAYIADHNPWRCFCENSCYNEHQWYLVMEDKLQPINREQMAAVIMDYVNPVVEEWIAQNGPLPTADKIPVTISNITLSKLKEMINECREHGDDSLMEELRRFRRYFRRAAKQHVQVTYLGYANEFAFSHYVNGVEELYGHIVFHGWPETGYQTNGSIQLCPKYGWSHHT